MFSENLYRQTRREGKQWGRIGFDASRATSGLFQSLGYDQAKLFASLFPQYASSLKNTFSWLSPGSQQSQIDAFRNNAIQSATQQGKQAALLAGWMGQGSGTQASLINSAGQRANNAIANFTQQMYSPENQAARTAGMMGLFNPTFAQQGQALKAGQNQAYPSSGGGLFGNILSAGAQLFGGGAFGNPFGGLFGSQQVNPGFSNLGFLNNGAGRWF